MALDANVKAELTKIAMDIVKRARDAADSEIFMNASRPGLTPTALTERQTFLRKKVYAGLHKIKK